MGKAFVVPGADYTARNLGKVTPSGSVPVEEITILGPSAVNSTGKFDAKISPVFSTQRGVVWSITSGAQYATIDQSGAIIVTPGTESQSITIKCESSVNSSIYATKTVSVSAATIVYKDYITTDGTDFVLMPGLTTRYNCVVTVRVTLGTSDQYSFRTSNGTQPNLGCYCSSRNKASAQLGSGVPKIVDKTNIVYRYVFTTSSVSTASDGSVYLYNDKTGASLGSSVGAKCYINGCFYILRNGTGAANATPVITEAGSSCPAGARFYGLTVVDGDNNTIADYRPCTYNDIPGIYDTVTNIFRGGYIGTGGLSAGND